MALFRNFGVNLAEGGQVGGIACAAYTSTPPRNSLISLNLQKIAHFWIGNLSVPFMKPRMGTRLKNIRQWSNAMRSLINRLMLTIFFLGFAGPALDIAFADQYSCCKRSQGTASALLSGT
jgi:hypothetical protein